MPFRYITSFTLLILVFTLPQEMFAQATQDISDHWVIKVDEDLTAKEQATLDQWLQTHQIRKQVVSDKHV